MTIDTNKAPYFDDFDADKNFHRILFRAENPGVTVQARELTQLQTILQNQISRLGDHVFKEGALVLGSGVTVHANSVALKISLSTAFSTISDTSNLFVKSGTTGVNAKVLFTVNADSVNPVTAFVEYIDSGIDNETTAMSAAEGVSFYTVNETTGVETTVATGTITAVTAGSWCNNSDSIYYVNGYFVKALASKIVLDRYGTTPTYRIGLVVTESIVTDEDDSSLKSAANGTSNYLSSGAHRLKVALTLTALGIDDEKDKGFIEIARVENGIVTTMVAATEYNLLADELARRTYEESGNYTVNPFTAVIREHLNDGTNGGLYAAGDGGDSAKLAFGITPGIAYVKGYRTENIATKFIDVNKARDTDSANNAGASALYGMYINVINYHSYPTIDVTKTVDLHDAVITGGASAGNIIGSARVRAMSYEDATTIRLHLFDVQMDAGKTFSDVLGIRYSDANNLFGGELDTSTLIDTGVGQRSVIFPLPYNAIKTLKEAGVDTTYTVEREFNGTTDGSGIVSFSVGADELFDTVSASTYWIAETGAGNAGSVVVATGSNTVLGGTPTGKSVTLTLGAGWENTDVKLIAPVIKAQPTERTKTKTVQVDTLAITGATLTLSKVDGFALASVVDTTTSQVITDQFVFDNGQRDNYYDKASITTKDGSSLSTTLQVTYDYFTHSVGDYFCVDSYSGIDYEDIPSFTGSDGVAIELRDAIDFRPVKNTSGGFTTVGELVLPNSTLRADIQYYLPRVDSIYVDKDGVFGVVEGISSMKPVAPAVSADSMKLFELEMDAYTFGTTHLNLTTIDNKRYTMRDIGKLEKRIENLEYYTTLNALEMRADSIEVVDPVTGNTRFKNGFVTDGFTDFRLGEVSNIEWEGAIDPTAGLFYPSFAANAVDCSLSTGTGYKKKTDLLLIDYTEVESTKQPYATRYHNINPYAVFTWNGNVVLTPGSDFWKDVKYNTPIQTNVTANTTGASNFGVVRGSWFRTSLSTTVVSSATSTDQLISSELIPFMRSIDIAFSAKGMRPYTKVYPFFSNDPITEWVKPDGGNYGDSLITDQAGTIEGTFTVPDDTTDRFQTGTNSFRLVDSTDNSFDPATITTSAQANHVSEGILETRQQTIVTTRVPRTVPRFSWGGEGDGSAGDSDPIAQTFRISSLGGEFITKVDIFFATKSQKGIPARLQIRTVENGYPTGTIVPLGEAWLTPSEITTSDDASVATAFVFDDPVYLVSGVEYAMVLLAETQEYNVFISEMGGTVLGGRTTISKQPSLGSFFTSQNASTWTAEQDKDLKFTLWRAQFNTSTPAVVEFTSAAPVAWIADTNPLTSTNSSTAINVRMKSHGLLAGDSVVIGGATDGNGQTGTEINKTHTVTSVVDIDNFIITSTATSTADGGFGGSAVTIKHNYPISTVYKNVNELRFSATETTWEYKVKSQSGRGVSSYAEFEPNAEFDLVAEGVLISEGDLTTRCTLTTTVDNLSPVVDMQAMTAALISNRINSDSTDEDVTGAGAAKCKYITKTVGFDNPSTAAKIYIGAYLPDASTMEIYYKLVVDDENIADKDWVALATEQTITNDDSAFNEYSALIDGVGSFSGLKVKIVLLGNDVINVPKLKDFRSISLA